MKIFPAICYLCMDRLDAHFLVGPLRHSQHLLCEVAVIGLPDEKWIEAVVAVVTLKVGQQVDAATLIAYAKQHIASFKAPKQVFFVDAMPRTASGKLLKRELRKQYANQD